MLTLSQPSPLAGEGFLTALASASIRHAKLDLASIRRCSGAGGWTLNHVQGDGTERGFDEVRGDGIGVAARGERGAAPSTDQPPLSPLTLSASKGERGQSHIIYPPCTDRLSMRVFSTQVSGVVHA